MLPVLMEPKDGEIDHSLMILRAEHGLSGISGNDRAAPAVTERTSLTKGGAFGIFIPSLRPHDWPCVIPVG